MLLYTDGVTEAINSANELYSEQRLIDTLGLNHNSPMDLNSHILNDVLKFEDGTEQTDDITILSLSF